ncbi:MAG: hypothetical protein IM526_02420 [Microcystis sp. M38BS1]|uniref:hypothetical protein n=1 Tax=Microcystis sp. M38BS1 TaxID=2771188 RepID=UPI0031FDC5B5|nr:hypothetical protein [Microcystis sp. M38BS1]MCA6582512.1 hypothetical protein [Pseudanabaena sp. M34BS1SP1A06MG]
MAKKLFEYRPFIEYAGEITEESGKRYYTSKCGIVCDSTTTVLSKYENKTNADGENILDKWGDKMRKQGQDPDRISEESARVGTLSHSLVEEYLLQGVYCSGSLVEEQLARVAIDNFYSHVCPEFANAEQPLFYDARLQKNPENFQLAGRYDHLVKIPDNTFQILKTGEVLESQYMICDLKTKRSYQRNKNGTIKTKALPRTDCVDMVFKNCLQLSMYSATISLMSNFKEIYGSGISGAALVYTNEEKTKILYLSRRDLNYYWRVFKEILRDFYGIKPLERDWKTMIAHANKRYNYDTGEVENNIPKEIVLVSK